tara:strand:- start:993 stop:1292 length:300 start_codon:yes stop_codon:yes gene_type:complete
MVKSKKSQLTKKDISKKINSKIGLSITYTNKITHNLILILKELIKKKEMNIKNFGSFRIIEKKERLGRNPKNKEIYLIKARRSLSFIPSKKIIKSVNKL